MTNATARRLVAAVLALEVVAIVVFLATIRSRNGGGAGIALVGVAVGAWVVLTRRLPALEGDRRVVAWVVGAIAIVCVAAVVWPSRQSDDAFLYGIYGRIVSVHHANPYRTVPADVPHDAIARFVGTHWVHTPSYYGPVWIAYSAVGTWLVPATKLAIRVLFQATSAAAIGAIAWVLWRRTRSIATVAFVALHPLVVLSVVNGGHNDGVMALCALVGVTLLIAPRSRPALAGTAFGAAGMIKATALLGALGAVGWLVLRGQRRAAAWCGAFAFGLVGLGAVATPGSIAALRGAGDEISFLSIWQTVRSFVHPSLGLHGSVWGGEAFGAARAAPFVAGLAVCGALAWWRHCSIHGAGSVAGVVAGVGVESAVGVGLSSYLVFGSWVQPWHMVWALPVVALAGARLTSLRRVVAGHAALLLVLFQAEDWIRSELWRPLRVVVIIGVPLAIAVAYAAAIARGQDAPTGRPSTI